MFAGETSPPTSGSFYSPTILSKVPDHCTLFCQEVFGPLISVTTFTDEDEVIQRANSTEMGLASYVFSKDANTIRRASEQLDF